MRTSESFVGDFPVAFGASDHGHNDGFFRQKSVTTARTLACLKQSRRIGSRRMGGPTVVGEAPMRKGTWARTQ